ncbi:hypothetical protein TGMAS_245746 [Toxoplasma gondii MAS]|uniref:Uncharacterized protein n=1 Tax=Toxoplasma gondii MAS TaxID=943118 RepID=A0A086PV28_TOXGO|nr:hypothetical protein TGMAS_245746 [Toxoplasma gondii MAS]
MAPCSPSPLCFVASAGTALKLHERLQPLHISVFSRTVVVAFKVPSPLLATWFRGSPHGLVKIYFGCMQLNKDGLTDVHRARKAAKLKEVLKLQVKEIETLKKEIGLFKLKGAHIDPTVLYGQRQPYFTRVRCEGGEDNDEAKSK